MSKLVKSFIELRKNGLYCLPGDFYIDPWKPVKNALITHAHADHSRWGNKFYLAHKDSIPFMKHRLGSDIHTEAALYNKPIFINGVKCTFHPAGHVIGSAMISLEWKGFKVLVSGDYKIEDDGFTIPCEIVKSDVFISESTFGLPVFQWEQQKTVFQEIENWWTKNMNEKVHSVLYAYSLGKAQRLLAGINLSLGDVWVHPAIAKINECIEKTPWKKSDVITLDRDSKPEKAALIIAPPAVNESNWLNKLKPFETAMASGWMTFNGAKRRISVDRGFVISDHADWKGLNYAVESTAAEKVFLTHGYSSIFAKWLRDKGYDAFELDTLFEGEHLDADDTANNF
ncbi:MAG: ligase-associated DNA damage response exonuclease [Chitinophagaceae bacterium]|nr:MAG: ligase-associated DNA damage response exonuclease [Chitinophagaceae bacterium]